MRQRCPLLQIIGRSWVVLGLWSVSCNVEYWIVTYHTIAPRMCRGAISPWYIGTSSEQAPTPNPVMNRPIMNWYHFPVGEEIWIISPTWRMMHQKKMDHFRPIRSVSGPARRAPINVPMESWKALAFATFTHLPTSPFKDSPGKQSTQTEHC